MYQIMGVREDEGMGRMVKVRFEAPLIGESAYLVGNFNAFNEGSLRMQRREDGFVIDVALPEGIWFYGFSSDGKFFPDDGERAIYSRDSYDFERVVSLCRVLVDFEPQHNSFCFGDVAHIRLRTKRGWEAALICDGEVRMRRVAEDGLFSYHESKLPRGGSPDYSFRASGDDEEVTLGTFVLPSDEKKPAPEWVYEMVFYQIMVDRFTGERDLSAAGKKIPYLKRLGINGVYLTPIYRSRTYHGYDVEDYENIGEGYGGNDGFREFMRACNEAGISVILDGVFHHTSFFHPWFQDIVERGRSSEFFERYRVLKTPVEKGKNYETFFRVWIMPRLNHESGNVRDFVRANLIHWANEGVRGFRMDVAHGVPPGFWSYVRKGLPEDIYLMGEVMDDARLYVGNSFHGVMNYPLYDAILKFFYRESIRAEEFLNELGKLNAYYGPFEYSMYNFLDNHDVSRFLGLVKDERKYLCAMAFLFTYVGIPSIFYGDEIGLRGVKEKNEEQREPMRWEGGNEMLFSATRDLISLRRGSAALKLGLFTPITFRDKLIHYRREWNGERIEARINFSQKKAFLNGMNIDPYSYSIRKV